MSSVSVELASIVFITSERGGTQKEEPALVEVSLRLHRRRLSLYSNHQVVRHAWFLLLTFLVLVSTGTYKKRRIIVIVRESMNSRTVISDFNDVRI